MSKHIINLGCPHCKTQELENDHIWIAMERISIDSRYIIATYNCNNNHCWEISRKITDIYTTKNEK